MLVMFCNVISLICLSWVKSERLINDSKYGGYVTVQCGQTLYKKHLFVCFFGVIFILLFGVLKPLCVRFYSRGRMHFSISFYNVTTSKINWLIQFDGKEQPRRTNFWLPFIGIHSNFKWFVTSINSNIGPC